MLFFAAASFARVGQVSLPFWLLMTIDWLWAATPTADSRLCRLVSHPCCSQQRWYLHEWKPTQALHFFFFFCLQRGKQSQLDRFAEPRQGPATCISAYSHTAEVSSWGWCHKCDVYGSQLLMILDAFGNSFWFYSRIWKILLRCRETLGPALMARGQHAPLPLSAVRAVIPEQQGGNYAWELFTGCLAVRQLSRFYCSP